MRAARTGARMTTETIPAAASRAHRGWGLTLRMAAILSAASLALFVSNGVGEESVRAWIRGTARASIALFLMTFVARPLHQLARGGVSSWLLANRRYLGVAAAYAQLLHGIAIVWLFTSFVKYEPDLTGLIGGGLGFALYFAMALTSSDAAVAALGRRAWKALHTVGSHWVWFVFAITNAGNIPVAFEKLGAGHQALYVGIQLALFGALGLRIAAWAKTRRSESSLSSS
jgi:sulfoxide reductase heme-binding subunit YedZ